LPLTNDNIDIHEFRQHYKPVFVSDLIVNTWNGDNKKSYLKGIPVWYETLGVFYNIKYNLIPTDFASLSSLKSAFKKIHHIWKVVPIAMWNWSTILNSGDLLAQQFLLNKINSLADITHSKLFKLSEYMEYWEWYNNYNKLFFEAKKYNKNNINLFLEGKVASIIAYPRVIKRLKSGNFTESFLAATAYPHSFSWDGPSLANYNYFVINKNTKQQKVAFSLLSYLNSDKWATEYLKKFNYYLPAKIKLEKELAGKKILEFYKTIELKDFYSDEPLSSFDKWNKIIFDEKIKSVLDDPNSYFSAFEKFKRSTLCTSEKILNLKNLTIKCE
jgi:maltose-binding protein MalE